MNKSELVDAMAEKSGLTKKDSKEALDAMVDSVVQALCEGEKVGLVGFGSFETRYRKERKGRNPATGEEMTIPAAYVPAFRVSQSVKDKVKESLAAE